MRALPTLLALLVLAAADCRSVEVPPAPTPKPAPAAQAPASDAPNRPALTPRPAPERLVAIGDVHGDLEGLRDALRLAGAIDAKDRWVGGRLVVVQVGDLLDRGDDELAVLALLARLRDEARAAGGDVVVLNGNHELMNVQGDLRYVTAAGFTTFTDAHPDAVDDPRLARLPAPVRARLKASLPGGHLARRLAEHPLFALVGDTLFVHAGVLPEHLTYGLPRLEAEARAWMRGEGPMPEALAGPTSPVWTRAYADEAACDALGEVLGALGARRMVVGHTVQPDGITSGCDGRLWRIDVGLARYYGAGRAVLEVTGRGPRVLTPAPGAPAEP